MHEHASRTIQPHAAIGVRAVRPRRRTGTDSIPSIKKDTALDNGGSVQQTFIRHAAHDEQTLIRYRAEQSSASLAGWKSPSGKG
jgi:hypothetical protein